MGVFLTLKCIPNKGHIGNLHCQRQEKYCQISYFMAGLEHKHFPSMTFPDGKYFFPFSVACMCSMHIYAAVSVLIDHISNFPSFKFTKNMQHRLSKCSFVFSLLNLVTTICSRNAHTSNLVSNHNYQFSL